MVLANGTVKDFALAGIISGAFQGGKAKADGFGGDQNAFRVQPVQDVLKPLALFADTVSFGDNEIFKEQLVGVHRLAAHFFDFGNLDPVPVKRGIEQR